MEWTKEMRYRRIEDASEDEFASLKEKIAKCPWRQGFHIQPNTGLLNDPNGFAYFNGEYHLFYQWFPLGPVHGIKYWYHMKSKDLLNWKDEGIGIEPKEYFESHGAFSGSGLSFDEKLYLFYTGNTRDKNWIRHPYQCMAVMNKEGIIEKFSEPVIQTVPKGYTDHFRDPKLWKDGDIFYAVIGAQRENNTGCAVLYRSLDLFNWDFMEEFKTDLKDFGYMWECPDYFELDDKGVFIFSPQGLQAEEERYRNIYQSGYLIGNKIDFKNPSFFHGEFDELDRGFDFYAPQTMLDPKGRRILVGWMGLPEIEYPSDRNGWAHCLTLPRELLVKNDKLIQKPIDELKLLRKTKQEVEDYLIDEVRFYDGFEGTAYELIAEFEYEIAQEFGIELRASEEEKTVIKFNSINQKIIFDRTHSGEAFAGEYGTARMCSMDAKKIKLHVFVDQSSVEVFINDGEEVFTGRIFPSPESRQIRFFVNDGKVRLNAVKWDYEI